MKNPLVRTPLFIQVADILRHEVGRLAPGAKLDTDVGLARRFSVSVSVVREALSVLTREGQIERYVGRGTFVTAPSSRKPLAIICDLDLARLGKPQHLLDQIQQCKRRIESKEWEVRIYLGDGSPAAEPPEQLTSKQFLKDLRSLAFGGVLATWARPMESWTRPLAESGIPLVGFGLLHENRVSHDFDAFIRLSLEELKKRRRTRIAYLSAVSEWNLGGYDVARRQKVIQLFHEAGFDVNENWFCQEWHHSISGAGWTSFREIWTKQKQKPDGIIVASPYLWPDVSKALISLNLKITENIDAVVARSNINNSAWNTSKAIQIVFDSSKLVDAAVKMLFDLLEKKPKIQTSQIINAWSIFNSDSCIEEGYKFHVDHNVTQEMQ